MILFVRPTRHLLPLFALAGLLAACRPSYRQAYRALERGDYPAARTGFLAFRDHHVYAPLAAWHLAWLDYRGVADPAWPQLADLDRWLAVADSLLAAAPPERRQKWARRYGVTDSSARDLRQELQRRALVRTTLVHTVAALDSLRAAIPRPLPALASEYRSTRIDIVNRALSTPDYDELAALLRRHLDAVLPGNYWRSRQLSARLLPAFVEKYGWCRLDSFAAAHPYHFFVRDCWQAEARALLCRADVPALLHFRARTPWTATEAYLADAVLAAIDAPTEAALDSAARGQLTQLRQREALRDALRDRVAGRDTAALLGGATGFIRENAPRYSAFQLLDETLTILLRRRAYDSAIRLLTAARPFFPDTLPVGCASNFDFQYRVRPYIDGKLPILRRPLRGLSRHPLDSLNTADGDEFSATAAPDGRELYFAGANRPDNRGGIDVFRADRWPDGAWSKPVLVPELSGPGDELPLSLTADGRELLLRIDGRLHLARRARDGTWSAPRPLTVPDLPLVGAGCLSSDGTLLIVEGAYSPGDATTPPDVDLFVCFRDSATGDWRAPVALGPSINSDAAEGRPRLAPDGRTLYFTSEGFPGLGRGDIFRATRLDDTWTRWTYPENLGKEINDTQPHAGFGALNPALQTAIFSAGEEQRDLWEGHIGER